MKAYKLVLLALDFENYGAEQIRIMEEQACGLDPSVMSIAEADIGEWSDDHPLNRRDTADAEFRRLFAAAKSVTSDAAILADRDALAALSQKAAVEILTCWEGGKHKLKDVIASIVAGAIYEDRGIAAPAAGAQP